MAHHILVIEDNVMFGDEIQDALSLEGFIVDLARDGGDGVTVARQKPPDLIICDLMLPDMSGFDVIEALRYELDTAYIPFIFLTAISDQTTQRKGMSLGADDFLVKTTPFKVLLDAIRIRLAKRDRQQLQQAQQLTQQMIRVQDARRIQLAELLNRDILPKLTGLRWLLVRREKTGSESPNVIETVDETLEALHLLSSQLNPAILERFTLLAMLLMQVETHGLQVDFEYENINYSYPPAIQLAVYYFVEESLENVSLYAGVQQVELTAFQQDNELQIIIKDEGVGFNLEGVFERGEAFGLRIIQERIRTCGGELHIHTAPNAGTILTCRLWVEVPKPSLPKEISPAAIKPTNQPTTQVVLANEHPLIRRGLIDIIGQTPDLKVIGEIEVSKDIVQLSQKLHPDVLVMDIAMYEAASLDILRNVKEALPFMRILMLVSRPESIYTWEALRHGADGCILASMCADELVIAIRRVHEGKRYISTALMQQSIETYPAISTSMTGTLTNRELEILRLIAHGHTNTMIADQLILSLRTVESHRANIMKKLNLQSKADLIRYAIKHGMVEG